MSERRGRMMVGLASLVLLLTATGVTSSRAGAASRPHRPNVGVRLGALQQLRDVAEHHPRTLVGVTTNGLGRVSVRLVKGAALPTSASVAISTLRADGATVTIKPADHSLFELSRAMKAVEQAAGYRRLVSTVSIDPANDRVVVGVVAPITPTLRRQLAGRASDVIAFRPAPRFYALGRLDDSSPFEGGDRIAVPGGYCTSGFAITNAYGTRYAVTAGHCGSIGDHVSSGGHSYGTISYNGLQNGQNFDAALVGGQRYSGYTWIGGVSTSTKQKDTRVQNSCDGCHVHMDGSYTGQQGAYLSGPPGDANLCVDVACTQVIRVHHTQLAISDDGSRACQHGDSGGPVIASDGNGGLIAVGTISGGTSDGTECLYTQLPPVLAYWKSTLYSGTG